MRKSKLDHPPVKREVVKRLAVGAKLSSTMAGVRRKIRTKKIILNRIITCEKIFLDKKGVLF